MPNRNARCEVAGSPAHRSGTFAVAGKVIRRYVAEVGIAGDLRRGNFTSVDDLRNQVLAFIAGDYSGLFALIGSKSALAEAEEEIAAVAHGLEQEKKQ